MQALSQCAPASMPSVRVRVNARGPARSAARAVIRARAISTSGGGSPVDAAWRGNTPKQSTLPVNPDGSVDYTRIDASPISKVLTATIRKLLVEEVGGVDKDPRPWTEFGGILARLGGIFKLSWNPLGASWRRLGTSWDEKEGSLKGF